MMGDMDPTSLLVGVQSTRTGLVRQDKGHVTHLQGQQHVCMALKGKTEKLMY